jgi:hypothetical protein
MGRKLMGAKGKNSLRVSFHSPNNNYHGLSTSYVPGSVLSALYVSSFNHDYKPARQVLSSIDEETEVRKG